MSDLTPIGRRMCNRLGCNKQEKTCQSCQCGAPYCGVECRVEDWLARHKSTCVPLPPPMDWTKVLNGTPYPRLISALVQNATPSASENRVNNRNEDRRRPNPSDALADNLNNLNIVGGGGGTPPQRRGYGGVGGSGGGDGPSPRDQPRAPLLGHSPAEPLPAFQQGSGRRISDGPRENRGSGDGRNDGGRLSNGYSPNTGGGNVNRNFDRERDRERDSNFSRPSPSPSTARSEFSRRHQDVESFSRGPERPSNPPEFARRHQNVESSSRGPERPSNPPSEAGSVGNAGNARAVAFASPAVNTATRKPTWSNEASYVELAEGSTVTAKVLVPQKFEHPELFDFAACVGEVPDDVADFESKLFEAADADPNPYVHGRGEIVLARDTDGCFYRAVGLNPGEVWFLDYGSFNRNITENDVRKFPRHNDKELLCRYAMVHLFKIANPSETIRAKLAAADNQEVRLHVLESKDDIYKVNVYFDD